LSDDPAAGAPAGATGRAAGPPVTRATDEGDSTAGTATDVQSPPSAPRPELGVPGKPFERHSPFYIGFFGGLGALLAFWLGSQLLAITSVLILVVVAMFLAVGLNPVVEFFVRRGLKRSYAVLAVIVSVVIALALFVVAIVPVISDQVEAITQNAPQWFAELQRNQQIQDLNQKYDLFDRAESYIEQGGFTSSLFGGVLGVGLAVLSTLLNAFIVVVLTLYFLSSLQSTKNALYRLAPQSRRDRVTKLGDRVLGSIGGYVSGAFIVATCAGMSSLIFLFIVGLGEYAVALAFVVALLDVIPMIGATIGAVIVTAIGFATDVKIGLACLIFYLVYQQIENYVVYPRVMANAADVPGAVTVVAVLAGATLLGVIGALLAIPTAAALLLLAREVIMRRQDAR
jgi:predicted PurR-regulated permease PerM